MKLTKLSNKLLKYMVAEFYKTGQKLFMPEDLQNAFSNFSSECISDALYLLDDDGDVLLSIADGQIYTISLCMSAMRTVEESTPFKRIYKFLKEIRSWF